MDITGDQHDSLPHSSHSLLHHHHHYHVPLIHQLQYIYFYIYKCLLVRGSIKL